MPIKWYKLHGNLVRILWVPHSISLTNAPVQDYQGGCETFKNPNRCYYAQRQSSEALLGLEQKHFQQNHAEGLPAVSSWSSNLGLPTSEFHILHVAGEMKTRLTTSKHFHGLGCLVKWKGRTPKMTTAQMGYKSPQWCYNRLSHAFKLH